MSLVLTGEPPTCVLDLTDSDPLKDFAPVIVLSFSVFPSYPLSTGSFPWASQMLQYLPSVSFSEGHLATVCHAQLHLLTQCSRLGSFGWVSVPAPLSRLFPAGSPNTTQLKLTHMTSVFPASPPSLGFYEPTLPKFSSQLTGCSSPAFSIISLFLFFCFPRGRRSLLGSCLLHYTLSDVVVQL